MRTTLKRGIGRGAAPNGDGRPILPPGVLTPVTRYRQPPRKRPGVLVLLGKAVLWLIATLLMLICALFGGYYLFLHESIAAIRPHSRDVKTAQAQLDNVPLPGHAAIALVIGFDHRIGDQGVPSRSDTIMLVRTDPATKSISLLSFPRDLMTEVRCPGKLSYVGRINEAYAECGSIGTLETVKALTGVSINYLISVDFHGFRQVVDRLGGVWIDVDRRYYNRNTGTIGTAFSNIDLQPGYQRLNGWNALSFVRYRHTDSDLYRVARQQEFVRAVRQQISGSFIPFTLPKIVNAIRNDVEIGAGGGTIDFHTALSYAKFAYGLPSGHVFQSRMENLQQTGPSGAELYAPPSVIQTAVQDFVNPDVEAPKKASAVALGRRIRLSTGPRPANVTVEVLNGNGVAGSAGNARYLLGGRGYSTVTPPNGLPADAIKPTGALDYGYFHTAVYFDPSQARSQAAARQLAKLFGDATVGAIPPHLRSLANGAMVVAVVGQTFHNNLAPAPVDRTPKRQPAWVRRDPYSALALLRSMRRRVPFRLEFPTIVERNSALDDGTPPYHAPLRVYEVSSDEKAVRLVFKTGAPGEYWGIEETDWADAPALSDKSFSSVLKDGRTYDFYYSGPHLHMVVLRENGANYWVVNTLVDSLSNETMIAIAKGLRPLKK